MTANSVDNSPNRRHILDLDNPAPDSFGRGLSTVFDAEFVVDVADTVLHGVFGNLE